jgi:outer membrane lipopolysaccharide assembly protein LptE/RlpB
LVIGALLTLVMNCGYHFAGSGSLPAGVSRVFITIFDNRTAETGLESTITGDLIFEFTRNRKKSVVQDRSAADAVLVGTITSLSVQNISRIDVITAAERQVTGIVNLRLESPAGQILWSSGSIVERQTFAVINADKVATDQNKSDAIAALSKKLAESAYNRMTDDF